MTVVAAPAASVKVEIGWTSKPGDGDASTTWTDVSADVRSVSTDRGRQVELNSFNAGVATVVLANRSAQYDPLNTAGPYYGNILPMKRIRISVSTDSITPEIFEGYVRSYQQDYSGTKDATTTLGCVDAFSVLANLQLPSGFYNHQIQLDSPTFYYRLDETAGSPTATDSFSNQTLTKNGVGTFGNPGLLTFDSNTAYTQPAGVSTSNFLFNGSSSVALLGSPGAQSMQFFSSATQQAVTTPDSTAFTGLTVLDIRVRLSRPDWVNGTGNWEDLLGKNGFVGQRGWSFFMIKNQLYFEAWISNFASTLQSAVLPPLAASSVNWVGVTVTLSGGHLTSKFYTHNDTSVPADITTWTLLATGTTSLTGWTVFLDNTVLPAVGARGALGGVLSYYGGPLVANVYEAVVRSSINGTIIAHPDFTDVAQWAVGDSSGTTGTDSTGKVWTAVGNEIINGVAMPFTAEAIVKWDTSQAVGAASNWIIAGQGDGFSGWYLSVNSSGQFGGGILYGGSLLTFAISTAAVTDGSPHHVAFTYDGSGVPRAYVDGVVGTAGTTQSVGFTGNGFGIGLASQRAGFGFVSWPGTIDEVAVYDYALTTAQLLAHSNLRVSPAAGDTTGQRINRITSQFLNWDVLKQTLDNGTVLLQAGAMGTDALSYLQKAAESDQGLGIFFISRDGKIVFQDAAHSFGAGATPVLTLDQTNFLDVSVQYDDTLIRNVVTVTRDGGTSQTVSDDLSVENYLTHAFAISSLQVSDDSVALQSAKAILAAYSNPAQRVTGITVNRQGAALSSAANYDKLLTIDIGDTLAVTYTPLGGVVSTTSYTIEGVKHDISNGSKNWIITYKLAPSLATLIPVNLVTTWVYMNSHFASWNAVAPRTWNAPSL